jgi:hypothetical protein
VGGIQGGLPLQLLELFSLLLYSQADTPLQFAKVTFVIVSRGCLFEHRHPTDVPHEEKEKLIVRIRPTSFKTWES